LKPIIKPIIPSIKKYYVQNKENQLHNNEDQEEIPVIIKKCNK
jgi:hypothetical protein